jgi:hypothetical protein
MHRRFAADADGNVSRCGERYLAAGVFDSDFLPEDDDEESDELFDDSLLSDEDELSDEELSEEDSLLLEAETPSLCSFISRARFFVP